MRWCYPYSLGESGFGDQSELWVKIFRSAVVYTRRVSKRKARSWRIIVVSEHVRFVTPKVSNDTVKEALEQMKAALVDAQSNVATAQQCMKRAVDKKRRTEQYNIGNEVVLSMENLWTCCPNLLPKIKAREIGPLSIQKSVSPVAFGLHLSRGWRIHAVFHISKLKRYIHLEEFLRAIKLSPPILWRIL